MGHARIVSGVEPTVGSLQLEKRRKGILVEWVNEEFARQEWMGSAGFDLATSGGGREAFGASSLPNV
ncbi:MAG: hypothetical protein JRM77_05375 [Nitrososphaerota archaeon]|jgi:hypothetical protein|nr:hypothetical protein [Nitrososphaerota archaeon]